MDGKQRLSTILQFVANKVYLPKDFGDDRLDGKRWRDLTPEQKKSLWDYPIPVELIDSIEAPVIKDVFARLNKNSRKLTRQELRHARFDGWFITFVEEEVRDDLWKDLKVRTSAKEKRMMDVQNLSELCGVVIKKDVTGFDQFALDELYADHEEADDEASSFDPEDFGHKFQTAKDALRALNEHEQAATRWAQPFVHLYSLWALIVLEHMSDDDARAFAPKYVAFMQQVAQFEMLPETTVDSLVDDGSLDPSQTHSDDAISSLPEVAEGLTGADLNVARYKASSVGASTELPQRRERLETLRRLLKSS
ncbi:hypothetical protein ASF37_10235 [Aeromicrobium sp. Leaf289]|nr:hypothetical protein ASF37_10235 [Aeromicrobium sp. Leaf289]